MKTVITTLIGLVGGILIYHLFLSPVKTQRSEKTPEKPLYWVAPMDDNYRRDEPGLSPMGMELVPVYQEKQSQTNHSPGTIHINAHVENQLAVKTAQVFYGPLHSEVISQGVLRYADTNTLHVHAKTKGWIKDLQVKSHGDRVIKGQLLYRLYSPEWVNAQQEMLLAMELNDTALIQAAEQRLTTLQFPKSVINQVKKKLQAIEDVPFYAERSGFITELNALNGHVIQPDKIMMVISDASTLWLDTEWFSQSSQFITPGTPITAMSHFITGRNWSGKIEQIYPAGDTTNKNIVTRSSIENTDGLLKANMTMTVLLKHQQQDNTLLVPRNAVIQTAQQNRVVLAMGSGQYKTVAVEIGQQNDAYFEVLSGIKAGDDVVVSAQFLLDSESSKTSDFIRMGEEQWPSASVNGIIMNIDRDDRTLTIHREAITKWQRPAATVDFWVENGLDISQFDIEQMINFTFEIRNGIFVIVDLEATAHD